MHLLQFFCTNMNEEGIYDALDDVHSPDNIRYDLKTCDTEHPKIPYDQKSI